MKIRCPHCQVIYNIPSAALEEAGHKVVCSECHNVFDVTPNNRDASDPAPPGHDEPSMDREMKDLLSDLERSLEGRKDSATSRTTADESFLLEELDLSLQREETLPDTHPLEETPDTAPGREATDAAVEEPPRSTPPPEIGDHSPFLAPHTRSQGRSPFTSILLALLLTVTAGAQIAWLQKDKLLTDTRIRELADKACSYLGCQLPPIAGKPQIHIVDRLFEPYLPHPGAYRLNLLLRNDGRKSAPLPRLQISLLDRQQQIMGRRTLPASTYAANSANAPLKPGQTREIHMVLLPPHPGVSGFELNLLPSDS